MPVHRTSRTASRRRLLVQVRRPGSRPERGQSPDQGRGLSFWSLTVIRYVGIGLFKSSCGVGMMAEAPSRRYSNGWPVAGSSGIGTSVTWLRASGSLPAWRRGVDPEGLYESQEADPPLKPRLHGDCVLERGVEAAKRTMGPDLMDFCRCSAASSWARPSRQGK